MARHNPASVCESRSRLCVQSGNDQSSRNRTRREPVHALMPKRVSSVSSSRAWSIVSKADGKFSKTHENSFLPVQGKEDVTLACKAGPFLCCGKPCIYADWQGSYRAFSLRCFDSCTATAFSSILDRKWKFDTGLKFLRSSGLRQGCLRRGSHMRHLEMCRDHSRCEREVHYVANSRQKHIYMLHEK